MRIKQNLGLILLGLVLVVPFLLREVDGDLEPYPAMLLPAGACLAEMGAATVAITAVEAYVVDGQGGLHQVQAKALMGRIPVQYFKPLASRRFGLEPHFSRGKWETRLGRDRDARWTVEDRTATRTWLLQRLIASGHEDIAVLRIARMSHVLDAKDGRIVESIVLGSYDIELRVGQ